MKVTRFDALKQWLVQQHAVSDSEIETLDEMVFVDGYDSETLVVMAEHTASDQMQSAQFIPDFIRSRPSMSTKCAFFFVMPVVMPLITIFLYEIVHLISKKVMWWQMAAPLFQIHNNSPGMIL